jgi:ketosteroid isomerase-like protein
MSEENVEIVRGLLEAFASRDHERAFDVYDSDIEWDASRQGLIFDTTTIYRGHDGVREYWRLWLSAWTDIEFEVEDILDGGEDVVALIRDQRQWGRHSGIETEVPPYGLVFTFRGTKVIRWRAYPDQRSALKAAGLSE